MRRLIIIFSLLYIPSLLAFSQHGKVSLQFVSFPKSNNAEPVDLLIGKEETLSIKIPTNNLSPIYEVNRMDEWAIGKPSSDSDGGFIFKAYGKTLSIDSPNQLILVIRKGAGNAEGLQLVPMNNEYSDFGGGEYFFMNAAMVDIAVEIGNLKFALKPQGRKIVKPEPSEVSDNRKYLYVYLHFRKGEEAVPYYSSTWRLSESARSMVFFYHDPHTKQLRTHTIRDYIRE